MRRVRRRVRRRSRKRIRRQNEEDPGMDTQEQNWLFGNVEEESDKFRLDLQEQKDIGCFKENVPENGWT